MDEARDLRDEARAIFRDALAAADARRAVLEALGFGGGRLRVFGEPFGPRAPSKFTSIAVGKAAASMASALDERLGDSLSLCVLSGGRKRLRLSGRWRVYEGGHPLPNAESFEAARAAFRLLDAADEFSEPVIFLVSGGGSAMMELPRDGRVALEDLREANRVLVSCGAAIDEVNAVRRALSAVKGGGLSARAPRSPQLTLIVSDVRRGREHDVASGPTLPPPSDAPDALEVVERYGLKARLPTSINTLLEESSAPRARADRGDAPRSHYVLLDNDGACFAASESARGRGFAVEFADDIRDQPVGEGAALLVSKLFERYAREAAEGREAGARGVCLVSGGEFACPVRGRGLGGRSSETALRCAFEIERALSGRASGGRDVALSPRRVVALCAGTDGVDGNSPAAGAVADDSTMARARALDIDAAASLEASDAYTFFNRLGDAIHTGPTGTNVRDLRILLAE